jgi:hypothetical protein
MAHPVNLTSFRGFNSLAINSNSICDHVDTLFSLQSNSKRSREESPCDSALSWLLSAVIALADEDEEEFIERSGQGAAGEMVKRRRVSCNRLAKWSIPDDSNIWLVPRNSFWYKYYIKYPDRLNASFLKQCRLRFRLPHTNFEEFAASLEKCDCFTRWHSNRHGNASRARSAPISLLLLASLRYIGRALTLDDLQEISFINVDVIRCFCHVFFEFGCKNLYDKYVRTPSTREDAANHGGEYEIAGFPGAVGSTDATHVLIERLSARFRQSHVGFKMSHTARTHSVTVNHRRQILSSIKGHPARWNDKTLATFDDFMMMIDRGDIFDDCVFELYDNSTKENDNGESSDSTIVKRRYRGAWLLVDNGYHSWPTTVPPIKTTIKKRGNCYITLLFAVFTITTNDLQ